MVDINKVGSGEGAQVYGHGMYFANNPMGVHHAWGRTYKDLWQRFFAMTQERNIFLSLFSPLILLVISLSLKNEEGEEVYYQRPRNHFYQYKPEIKLFDNLLLAFSRGIINPKIYA